MSSRVDYEACWDDLQAKVLERDGWGTKQLIAEMAHLRVRHRIKEGLFERFLRLYAGRLAEAAVTIPREDESSVVGATTASGGAAPTGAPKIQEDRDDHGEHHRTDRRRAAA